MKTFYMIGGTMGVGKTTVCQDLKNQFKNSVFLDGDWCWDASPFQVTEETKRMVIDNICYLLNNFLHCGAYETILFCWVLHQQEIIDEILGRLDIKNCQVHVISLTADEAELRSRILKDIKMGVRSEEVMERSVKRLPLYDKLETVKVDTSGKTITEITSEIKSLNNFKPHFVETVV